MKSPPLVLLLAASCSLAFAFDHPTRAAGLVLIACVLYPLTYRPDVLAFMHSIGPRYAGAALALTIAVLAGQLISNGHRTFPFITWSMYGTAPKSDRIEWTAIEGVTLAGEAVSINPSRLFPLLDRGTHRMTNWIDRFAAKYPKDDTIREILIAIARTYEREHAVSFEEIRMVRMERHYSSSGLSRRVALTVSLE